MAQETQGGGDQAGTTQQVLVVAVEDEPLSAQHFKCVACGNRGMSVYGKSATSRGIKRYRRCTACGHSVTTVQKHGDIERPG